MKKIKFNIPFFNKKHIKNLDKLFRNKKLSGNQLFTNKCQNFLKKKYNFKNNLLTDSCSSAFEIIATSLRNLKNKEVIVSSYNYPTVASAFIKNGFKIIFVDNEKNTPFIDKEDLKKKISKNTGCIVITHHYGYYENIDFYLELKKKYNLILIEDAAQSIDLKYKSKSIGSFGDFGAISFHETKNIQCGLGGCLIINNKKYLKKCNHIWNRGTNRSDLLKKNVKSYYWTELGSNFYPSEFQSLILLNQFNDLKKITSKRKEIFLCYLDNLKRIKNKFFVAVCNPKSNFHSVYLVCNTNNIRNSLKTNLLKHGIQATSHYEPLHTSEFARKNKKFIKNFNCKNANDFSKKILRLPLHLYLKKKDVSHICLKLKNFNYR